MARRDTPAAARKGPPYLLAAARNGPPYARNAGGP
jgi:hypothetical protein